jgi:hypothetical protein
MPNQILKIALKPQEERTVVELLAWMKFINNCTVREYGYAMKLNDLFK